MDIRLACDLVAQHLAVILEDGHGGFVAGGFDGENDHDPLTGWLTFFRSA